MLFPLKFRPTESYHEPPRSFGSRRDHGRRKHAGCDLYAPVGTAVLAVADGTVLAVYPFYQGSWAVEVDHGTFTVRYGEVKPDIPTGITPGAQVNRGDLVGRVGHLTHITQSMLHFEMYAGTATGALTDRSNPPFMRRSDLMDPTAYLDAASLDAGTPMAGTTPLFPSFRNGSSSWIVPFF